MIRVKGKAVAPTSEPMLYSSILVKCIEGSLEVLPSTYAQIPLNAEGEYDFTLLKGTYRFYANYCNSMKVDILGECTISDGLPEEITINRLVTNHTPVAPDWSVDLDDKWNDIFNDLINDVNTQISSLGTAIQDGDAEAIRHMATYVNEVTGQQGASLTDAISVGDIEAVRQSKVYMDQKGNELANIIDQVETSVATVSSELSAYKDSSGKSIAEINERITNGESSLGTTISSEVNAQTGEMENRINSVIEINNAAIEEDMSLVVDELGKVKAAWQIVATVDELTSVIGMVNDGESSTIYMEATKLILTNSNKDVVNGSAPFYVENGKVYINSAYIKKLVGNQISSETTLIAGSGNTTAGMNGDDRVTNPVNPYAGYRFWAGHSNPALAPYQVDKNGIMRARGGYLNNMTIEENCIIKGVIYVEKIVGESYAKTNLSQPRAVIYGGSIQSIVIRMVEPVGFDRVLSIKGGFQLNAYPYTDGQNEEDPDGTTHYRRFNVARYINGSVHWYSNVASLSLNGDYIVPANTTFSIHFVVHDAGSSHGNAYGYLGTTSGTATVGVELYKRTPSIQQG